MGAVVVISFREGLFVKGIHLGDIINFAQTANLALSLLANILATSVIAVKAWCVPSRCPCRSIILLTAP
jgi:hypothetical protein